MNRAVWRLPRIAFGLRNIWLSALRNWRWFLLVEESLFTGIAVERPRSLDTNDRTSTEGITSDDTFEADFGKLLENVYVKGMASPPGFEPGFQP